VNRSQQIGLALLAVLFLLFVMYRLSA